MIYTASWHIAQDYLMNPKFIVVCINRQIPLNYEGNHLIKLAPSALLRYGYKNNVIDIDDYEKQYIDGLDKEYIDRFARSIMKYNSSDKHIILFSREKWYKFSHRRILSNYMKEKYNINMVEM